MHKISLDYTLNKKGRAESYESNLSKLTENLDEKDAEKVEKEVKKVLQIIDNIYSQSKYGVKAQIIKSGTLEFELVKIPKVKK